MRDKKSFIKNKSAFYLVLFMSVCFFCIISQFSAQAGTISNKKSKFYAEKIVSLSQSIGNTVDDVEENSAGSSLELRTRSINYIIRKGAHFFNFFILGFLYLMLTNCIYSYNPALKLYSTLFCGFFAACIDETHQLFVPGRSTQVWDIIIDFSGVIGGCIVFLCLLQISSKKIKGWFVL